MKKISAKTKCTAVGIAAVIIAIALFIGGMSLLDWQFMKLDSTVWEAKNYTAEAQKLDVVSLDCDISKVEIVSGDSLAIDYEESEDTKYDVSYEDGKLAVRESRKFRFKMFDFHTPTMKITLPHTDRLKLDSVNGNCNLSNMKFERVEIGGTNLNVTLSDITVSDGLYVTSVNGNIELKRVDAKSAEVKSTNGKVILDNASIAEKLYARTVNGKINTFKTTAATAELNSTNGKIDMSDTYADTLSCKTVNGTIAAYKIKSESIDLQSTNGKINVRIIGDRKDYRIECSSVNGRINEANKTDGIYSVKAKTVNGNIEIVFEEEGESDD